jgi:hypothetical protein
MALFEVTISFTIEADHQSEALLQAKDIGAMIEDDGYAQSFHIVDVEESDDGSGVDYDEGNE